MNTLILGLGNILLGDEGVGVRIVEELERRQQLPGDVTLVDGGTSGMELLDIIAQCDHLIVCDAISADQAPGSVLRMDDDAVPAFFQTRLSPHQLGLCDLLAALRLIDAAPSRLTLFGVVPVRLDIGTELSGAARRALEQVVGLVHGELGADSAVPEGQALPARAVL